MNALAHMILALSATGPTAVSYAIAAAAVGQADAAIIALGIATVLAMAASRLLNYGTRNLQRHQIVTDGTETADDDIWRLFLLYLLSVLSMPRGAEAAAAISVIGMLVVAVAMVRTGAGYHFNPLLVMTGWHFYKINPAGSVDAILVTKRRLYRRSEPLTIGKVSETLRIELNVRTREDCRVSTSSGSTE